MTRHGATGILCVAFVAALASEGLAARAGAGQSGATKAAAAAAQASPALVGALSKAIGTTPEQSAGAAGALFGVAKSRLRADEFSQVASAVPGMDVLLKAAPAGVAVPGLGSVPGLPGSAGGLAGAASAFSKLGLSPDLVARAVPVLTSFVTKSGGANAGQLLAGVLK